jgi:ADP-ribose pyrophosphatase
MLFFQFLVMAAKNAHGGHNNASSGQFQPTDTLIAGNRKFTKVGWALPTITPYKGNSPLPRRNSANKNEPQLQIRSRQQPTPRVECYERFKTLLDDYTKSKEGQAGSRMLKKWKTISSETKDVNPWWTYKLDHFEIPGDNIRGEYYYVHTNGSSMVIPLTAEGKIILVNQYRYLCDGESVEFPCGCVEAGHDYLQTAHEELQQETGYRAGKMTEVGLHNPYNGVTDEISKVFLAEDLQPGRANPEETEEFELLTCTSDQIDEMIRTNKIWDGMTLAAWALARHKVLEILGR